MRKTALSFVFLFLITFAKAQTPTNVITTGVPFLLVAADARSAGMADNGVASSADAFSQQWNPAKYAFAIDKTGFSISYTPYLTDLVNDISLGQLTYYNRINERSAIAGSLRYFSLGEIELRADAGPDFTTVKPSEFAFDGSYSLKLSEKFSLAVAGRFISSNLGLTTGGQSLQAANSFAFDFAGFFQSEEVAYNDFNGRWRAGFNFQNMGPKINYDLSQSDNGSNFLPANLKIGTGFDFILDDYNKVALNVEFNKLLVPSPQTVVDLNNDGIVNSADSSINNENYNSIGWLEGTTQSFSDASGGFSEELKEITYSAGAEYLYQDSFALRMGYFHENPDKGARQYFSLGAGFKYTTIKVDVSYLFSTSKVKNPLENTLRFSLTFNFGDQYDEY